MVQEVLRQLRNHGLYLKLEKCKFKKDEIDFLGLILQQGHVAMDSTKVQAIQDWPKPQNVLQIWSFVQFCNFYRSFIDKFAEITVPFNNLLKKNVKWTWYTEEETVFTRLRNKVTNNVTLLIPVPGVRF